MTHRFLFSCHSICLPFQSHAVDSIHTREGPPSWEGHEAGCKLKPAPWQGAFETENGEKHHSRLSRGKAWERWQWTCEILWSLLALAQAGSVWRCLNQPSVAMGAASSTTESPQTLKKPEARIQHQHWAFNGPYAPVDDEVFETLTIREGKIPADLQGCYVRNGPNPLWNPPSETSNYHWFLGDGMVHAVQIKDGSATYNNHFLRTKTFQDDQKYGKPAFDKIAYSTSMASFLSQLALEKAGLVRSKNISGPSNTNLVYHSSRLMALSEADYPMELQILLDGHLQSAAEYAYNDTWNPHPKIDPVSGKLYWMNYDVSGLTPNFTFGVVDAQGKEERNCVGVLGGGKAVMIHDCGITEQYAIVIDCPVLVGIENYSRGGSLWSFDPKHGSRIGIFPKDGESGKIAAKWFQIDTCWIFHLANAWEEGNEVVVVVVRWDRIDMSGRHRDDGFLNGNKRTLHEYRFDMDSGAVSEKSLATGFDLLEFPVVNQKKVGRKTRFTWAAGNYEGEPVFHRIFKFDLSQPGDIQSYACTRGDKKLTAGEAYFVSKGNEEDDGYLMSFVINPDGAAPSSFLVLNGKSLESLCIIDIQRRRIPLGFHGLWVSEDQVQQIRAAKLWLLCRDSQPAALASSWQEPTYRSPTKQIEKTAQSSWCSSQSIGFRVLLFFCFNYRIVPKVLHLGI